MRRDEHSASERSGPLREPASIRTAAVAVTLLAWLVVTAATSGCDAQSTIARPASATTERIPPSSPTPVAAPAIPTAPGRFAPSFAAITSAGSGDDDAWPAEDGLCVSCHADEAAEWRGSAHRHSSFTNPFYRVAFDAFADARGAPATQFCGGCHDPRLMLPGGMPEEVDPTDAHALAGVGCVTCHSIVDASTTGNASYRLSMEEIPLPRDGDPASLEAHRRRLAPDTLGSPAMCASCHRGFVGPDTGHPHLSRGLDEHGPWRDSGWNQSPLSRVDDVPPTDCVGCHMPPAEDGTPSHRFPGGHTALASGLGDAEQLRAIEALLAKAATVRVAGVRNEDGRSIIPASEHEAAAAEGFALEVVVWNRGVGHRFPGGARDLRDTWLEISVYDDAGELLASSGRRATPEDVGHRLGAGVIDERADVVQDHDVARFRIAGWDGTIGPRDAHVVRYRYAPETDEPRTPTRVVARLLHRRLTPEFQSTACRAARTARGQAFDAATHAAIGAVIDACGEQPVVEQARHEVAFQGSGALSPHEAATDAWLLGLGLLHERQEHVGRAAEALDQASALLDTAPEDDPLLRARIEAARRNVSAAIGRPEEIDASAPDAHPSVAWAAAWGSARAWRWERAARLSRRAVDAAPDDVRGWRLLAQSLGSLGDSRAAAEAARGGLALEPRDASLLRSQYLALRALEGTPEAYVDAAHDAWWRHRADDARGMLQGRCVEQDPRCALERIPAHTHELTTATR